MSRTLFRHNRIWTGVAGSPWATALLVEDGRVVAVGPDALDGSADKAVDLPGAVVLPGLHDAHLHTGWLAQEASSVDLRPARSLDEAVAIVAAFVRDLPAGVPVRGGRWNANTWEPPAVPHRGALDVACPDRPVVLPSVDGHSVWVNSAALKAAGITRDTPDPVGGEIVRDATGEPTGVLREAAINLLGPDPDPGPDTMRQALQRVQRDLLSVGLTAITDIDGEEVRAGYVAMRDAGTLRLRVTKCIRDDDLELAIDEGRRAGDGDELLRVGPVKFFSDGALGSRTAHLTQPYRGHESCGLAVTPYPVLVQRIHEAVNAGLDVCTHAIGDAANHLVLDAYADVRASGPRGAAAVLRIEHAQHVLPSDVARFAELDVIASMQPTHCTTDLDLVDAVLGDRPLASYAWRTMLDAGVTVAFGSDAPVEEPNPFHALHAAVARQRVDGHPPGGWQPAERITLDEAVHAHTVAAHEAARRTDAGRLALGQVADFVCVDRDLWDLEHADPAAIRDARALQTWVGGELAFER
jgi:predicted amidohydrolase YtcJ